MDEETGLPLPVRIDSDSAGKTLGLGRALGRSLGRGDMVLLSGNLGAGKTQFAKGVVEGLGLETEAVSPTFNIMLEYGGGRIPLVHMDLYRLDDPIELEDIDFYMLTDDCAEHACIIEWADLFPEEMPEDSLHVHIARDPDSGDRLLEIQAHGLRSRSLLERWIDDMR